MGPRAIEVQPVAVANSEGSKENLQSNTASASQEKLPEYWCAICQKDLYHSKDLLRHLSGRKHRVKAVASQEISVKEASMSQVQLPKHWCHICKKDLESAKCLRQHVGGRPHREKAKKQGVSSENTAMEETGPQHRNKAGVSTGRSSVKEETGPQPESSESLRTYIKRCIPEVDDFGCLVVDDSGSCPSDGEASVEGFDEAVTAVALYNYETFYNLSSDTATVEVVAKTSAGILGWASCVLQKATPELSQAILDDHKNETISLEDQKPYNNGDEKEDLLLQQALLESIGVKVVSSVGYDEDIQDDDEGDDDNCSYIYDSDGDNDDPEYGNDIDNDSCSQDSNKAEQDEIPTVSDLEQEISHCSSNSWSGVSEESLVSTTTSDDNSESHDESWSHVSLDFDLDVRESSENDCKDWYCL